MQMGPCPPESENPAVDLIRQLIEQGRPTKTRGGGLSKNQVMTILGDKTKAIFRLDAGEFAHQVRFITGNDDPADHMNIEIQGKTGRVQFNQHIMLDENNIPTGIFDRDGNQIQ